MELTTVLSAARAGGQLAEVLGMWESRTAAVLGSVDRKVSALAEAPLREGLRRLADANLASSDERRLRLLDEARQKFQDAASRELDPLPHALALHQLAQLWYLLGEDALAGRTAKEAADAAEEAWGHYIWELDCIMSPPTSWWKRVPEAELKECEQLAKDAIDLALMLDLPVDEWLCSDDNTHGSLVWIDDALVAERRSATE